MKRTVLACLVLGTLLAPGIHGQSRSDPTRWLLPPSISPNDIEIRMTRGGHGGCQGRCVDYRVTISGDGLVRYEDLASPPVPQQTRRVSVDEVVALANEFVRARFLEAGETYDGDSFYVLRNGQLQLLQSASADYPEWDLTFRLGTLQKSVHLEYEYPDYLGRLKDLVDKVGGPAAWTGQ